MCNGIEGRDSCGDRGHLGASVQFETQVSLGMLMGSQAHERKRLFVIVVAYYFLFVLFFKKKRYKLNIFSQAHKVHLACGVYDKFV